MTEENRKFVFELFKHLTTLNTVMLGAGVAIAEKVVPAMPGLLLIATALLFLTSLATAFVSLIGISGKAAEDDQASLIQMMQVSVSAFLFGLVGLCAGVFWG